MEWFLVGICGILAILLLLAFVFGRDRTDYKAMQPVEQLYSPGKKLVYPGEYVEVDKKNGLLIPDGKQVTMEPGDEKFPPTSAPNRGWKRIESQESS
jgi:hypothetical protein